MSIGLARKVNSTFRSDAPTLLNEHRISPKSGFHFSVRCSGPARSRVDMSGREQPCECFDAGAHGRPEAGRPETGLASSNPVDREMLTGSVHDLVEKYGRRLAGSQVNRPNCINPIGRWPPQGQIVRRPVAPVDAHDHLADLEMAHIPAPRQTRLLARVDPAAPPT